MLQEFVKEGHGGLRPEGALGQGVSMCFQCEDAVALYREFRSRGIDAKEPFVGNSMWVTVLSDPDGYKLDFESATDVPEDTKLSEVRKVTAHQPRLFQLLRHLQQLHHGVPVSGGTGVLQRSREQQAPASSVPSRRENKCRVPAQAGVTLPTSGFEPEHCGLAPRRQARQPET